MAASWDYWPATILRVAKRMKKVVIECRDAHEVIRRYDSPGTLFYCDPPYVGQSARDLYACDLPDLDQHRQLADLLSAIDGMAIVSGWPSKDYDALWRGWRRVDRSSPSMQHRGLIRTESLYLSPNLERQHRPLFDLSAFMKG